MADQKVSLRSSSCRQTPFWAERLVLGSGHTRGAAPYCPSRASPMYAGNTPWCQRSPYDGLGIVHGQWKTSILGLII
jgi:hypothetical protein